MIGRPRSNQRLFNIDSYATYTLFLPRDHVHPPLSSSPKITSAIFLFPEIGRSGFLSMAAPTCSPIPFVKERLWAAGKIPHQSLNPLKST
ncbi:hypothetical protein H5410_050155 [Solanum commersonii]|uniref:Uncharacterized protein n=1 Tax=Solanum commersonii TaxID=4109 RepID=A0A9J5WX21_SOLCO|nr:hypothetical protein H5410_050155 [Solanum commersonii]